MASYTLFILLASTLVATIYASDTCDFEGNVYEKDEVFFMPDQCAKFKCKPEVHSITRSTCAPKEPRPHCTITAEDTSKQFPDCCPQYKCDEKAGCYYNGKNYEKDEVFLLPGECRILKCTGFNKLMISTCHPLEPRPNCTIASEDNSKQFPDCCPQYKCVEEPGCKHEGKNYKKYEVFVKPGRCTQFVCMDDGEVAEYDCAPVTPLSNCKITPVDESKPYPQCCPNYECSTRI